MERSRIVNACIQRVGVDGYKAAGVHDSNSKKHKFIASLCLNVNTVACGSVLCATSLLFHL